MMPLRVATDRLISGGISAVKRNADVLWDLFSSAVYKNHNYAKLGPDDRAILNEVRDFFAASAGQVECGVDAGAGPNLYPMLSMLPFCRRLELIDISEANVRWMRRELLRPDKSWDEFWQVLSENKVYKDLGDYRPHLIKATALQGNIFHLQPKQYDIGTMFFVSESLTDYHVEFENAVLSFVRSLKDNAPFAIAFMSGSLGYRVDDALYPAVAIQVDDVRQCLEKVAKLRDITKFDALEPIRHGYDGMMLATGWVAHGAGDGPGDEGTSAA